MQRHQPARRAPFLCDQCDARRTRQRLQPPRQGAGIDGVASREKQVCQAGGILCLRRPDLQAVSRVHITGFREGASVLALGLGLSIEACFRVEWQEGDS